MKRQDPFETVLKAAIFPLRREILFLLRREEKVLLCEMEGKLGFKSENIKKNLHVLMDALLVRREVEPQPPYRSSYLLTELGKQIVDLLEEMRAAAVAYFRKEKH
jgi:DNA-binding HxlR family transcriptional regulator